MFIQSRTPLFRFAILLAIVTSLCLTSPSRAQDGAAGGAAPTPSPNDQPQVPQPQEQPAQQPAQQQQQQQPTAGAAATQPQGPTMDDVALAERFADFAQSLLSLPGRTINETSFNEASCLLEAATRLNPYEPRFFRLLSEAELQRRNPDGALAALSNYTALESARHEQVDQGALTRIIDLNAAKMESAGERLDYYKSLIDKAGAIRPEVRSYVAVRAAKLYLDREQDTEATQMIDQALRLNSLNYEGLLLHLSQVDHDPKATPIERLRALLSLIRSNPAQPAVMTRIASELADAGVYKESHYWYTTALQTANRMGYGLDRAATLQDAFIAYMIDDLRAAELPAAQILQVEPYNPVARQLILLVARRRGADAQESINRAKDDALTSLLEQVYNAHRDLNGGKDLAATQPTGALAARLGDVTADVKQINDTHNDDARARLALALEDLAWFELYFNDDADSANAATPLIEALRQLLGDDAPAVARLQGWQFLRQNKPDEARVKLTAVADRDPLAAMGVALLSAKSQDATMQEGVKAEARRLVSQNPSGLIGATLLDGLREYGAQLVATQTTDAIRQTAEQFPKLWLQILDKPQTFYRIRAVPDKISYAYGEPMYATVTITNTGPEGGDLTIGHDGVIKPDLWFDVKFSGGINNVSVPGAAFDRVSKALVLRPGEFVQQVVRLDQRQVSQGLQNPIIGIQMFWSVLTNPMTTPAGIVVPGAAGQRVSAARVIQRLPSPIMSDQQMQQAIDTLKGASPDVRMRSLELLGTYVKMFLSPQQTNDEFKRRAGDLMAAMDQTMRDMDNPPALRLWAGYVLGALKAQPQQRNAAIQQMAKQDYWPAQVLALTSALTMGDAGKPIAQQLTQASDPLVKRYADAVAYDLAHPTTQPSATQPTAGAATQPTAEQPAGASTGLTPGFGLGTTPPPTTQPTQPR